MKNIIFAIIGTFTIISNVYALDKPTQSLSKLEHAPVYLRLDLLAEKFHKASVNNMSYKHQNYAYGIDFGLGYYVMSKLRLEAIYNHNFLVKFKSKDKKDKADAKVLFLRSMFDIVTIDKAKLFIGGGIGGARISHKMINNYVSTKSSSKTNLAYSLHAGVSLDVQEGVIIEASWSMRNYGKTGNIKDVDNTKLKLSSQIVALGFRFDV